MLSTWFFAMLCQVIGFVPEVKKYRLTKDLTADTLSSFCKGRASTAWHYLPEHGVVSSETIFLKSYHNVKQHAVYRLPGMLQQKLDRF